MPAAVMVPTAGLSDQVTDVLAAFVTVAVNCCDWESTNEELAGVMDTPIGAASVTTAFATFVESATLVAVTVTVCPAVVPFAGAV